MATRTYDRAGRGGSRRRATASWNTPARRDGKHNKNIIDALAVLHGPPERDRAQK